MRAHESTSDLLELNVGVFSGDYFLSEDQQHINETWRQRIQELHELSALEDNWDGEGAIAAEQDIFEIADAYLQHMSITKEFPPPTRISLSMDGEIIFEWQFANGTYLEAAFSDPNQVEWMSDHNGVNHQWGEVISTGSSLDEWEDAFADTASEVAPYTWTDQNQAA